MIRMSASIIKVNTDSLHNDISSIAESIGNIERSVKGLEDAYAALSAMWEGPACEVFRVTYLDDIENLRTVIGNLKKINGFETEANNKYTACEGEIGSLISSLKA